MAGITNGKFCNKMSVYGFDILTIGGYNADQKSIDAGLKIIKRGRSEFDIAQNHLKQHIINEIKIIKNNNNYNGLVSVNLRASSPDPIIKISEISEIDIIEINAHCRQEELIEAGCGQALLRNSSLLKDFISKVVENCDKKVSVKIRANVAGVDIIKIVKAIDDAGADFLHVDAMKPGFDTADYDIIKSIKKNVDIFIIGNNSVKDLISAQNMLSAGANGISIARAAINGNLSFDLSRI
ncbi:MAG: tRNA-dihydrouridine synthase [Methanobacterium sp.]|nr:tRNA-dihydrouridine synthase [Methanobacterium sp.]